MLKFVEGDAAIQGSESWHELRRSKIGASTSPVLLGLSPYKNSSDIFKEMLFGEKPYINKSMKHGSETEEEARTYFNNLTLSDFQPAVVESEEFHFLMASLDGINETQTTILEIKVPGEKVFSQCLMNNIPIHWEYQIQHQLAVTGLDLAILFVYIDPQTNLTFRYIRNENRIQEIISVCKNFHEKHLLTYTSPESKETLYAIKLDQEWEDTVASYLQFKKQRVSLEETEKVFYEKLISLADDKPTKGCGVRVERTEKKGLVDYSLIEEIRGINLDQYRKPAKIQWRICETKD